MRKNIKSFLFAAALSALYTISSVAADGWRMENNEWVYYKNSEKVYNSWAKSSDGNWYYLGSNGYMLKNQAVDGEEYFVDSDGKMLMNSWRKVGDIWYYYGSDGKSVTNKSRQINGQWYYFGYDGMLTGWVEDDNGNYYFYDQANGNRYSNVWVKTTPPPDTPEDDFGGPEYDGTHWFYFNQNGKMCKAEDEEYKEFSINGNRYAFDQYGRMQTGWVKLEDKDPVISGYKYFNDSEELGSYGSAHVGWLAAYAPENEEGFSTDVEWFYFDSKGNPYFNANISDSDDVELLEAKLKTLESNGSKHKYLFNEYGNLVYGLRMVRRSNGDITSMYFGTKNESCLQLGNKNITDADGETSPFYFDGSGYGYTGVKNGKLYYMGKLQKALDNSYAYYTVDGKTYLVNKRGQIRKNYNQNKESDEVDYKSDKYGYRDGGNASESELLVPAFVISDF